jgi:hypothetical protein
MSTKLYNGYRIVFPYGFNLFDWQEKLGTLRDELEADAEQKLREDYARRAVYALDRDTLGLGRRHRNKSPLGHAYKSIEADIDGVKKGKRHPLFDTEVTLCWKAMGPLEVFIILYAEVREYRDRVIEALDLEDYHYQNQTDPEGCTWDEMVERGKRWEAALGDWNNPPSSRFHAFTLCETSRHAPITLTVPETPPYHKGIPLEDRAKSIALDLLWADSWEEAPGNTQASKLLYVQREAQEGGSLHARFLEFQAAVTRKLLVEPTWEDYRRVPEV